MINYQQYEQDVYNWLLTKHQKDNAFTFSLRQKASKSSETDIFIGTEKSNYFGTTFWTLPVYYPGSSSDCINLIFGSKGDYYGYKFEFSQTNTPEDAQNQSVLNVIKAIQEPLKAQLSLQREGSSEKKMFAIVSKHRAENYTDLNTMLLDVEKDLEVIMPIVNNAIKLEKKQFSKFTAHPITTEEFTKMQNKYEVRKTKYSNRAAQLQRAENTKYWLYAPGRNAMYWDAFYEDDIIGLGWDKLGNLEQYSNKDAVKKALFEAYGGDGNKMNDVNANFEFATEISVGDIIIVKKGRGELLGYGEVTSNYFFDENRTDYKSCRSVKWIKKGNWPVSISLVLKTLTDVTKYPSKFEGYTHYYQHLIGVMNGDTQPELTAIGNSQKEDKKGLNQIFYGPPGTGKTYHTINEALSIANPSFNLELEREFVKTEYERLVAEKQIVFTTFHQSMSYEDFVEGIKPKTNNGLVTYEIEDGIFKKICENAELYNTDSAVTASKKVDLEKRINKLRDELEQSEDSEIEIKMTKASYHITQVTDKHIKFRKASGGTGHDLVIDTLKAIILGERDIIGGLRTYYDYLIQYLNAYSFTEERVEANKPFVLIIDEINRANVSATFGELITLIETSKRKGNSEALQVQLPYSKQPFSVPNNLYIIGTMNTADRSVEALDTALRRRFEFKEMMPDYTVIADEFVEDVALSQVLQTINKRIELLIDRDHCIGHSYFFGVDTTAKLANTFNNNIVPLLQEYFYGDYGKIGLVLGAGFVQTQKNDTVTFANFKYENANDFKAPTFSLKSVDEHSVIAATNLLLGATKESTPNA